jgi:methylmalonyl-CoA/ethylmalonyl-CoA epimerase
MAYETSQTVTLGEIVQVALTVTDLARARDFYQTKLGMQFLFDAGSMIFFQCGSVRLMVGTSPELVPGSGTILYFRVAAIHDAYTALRDQGVTFEQEPHVVARMKSHDLWLAIFKDPDGNTLALMSEDSHSTTVKEMQ